FQSDHEIAKLIGAPPGYIGHGDSKPRLTQGHLAEVKSPDCDLSLVLFDEIEKAAPAMTQLLLGILDRATLRLGDGTEVDFAQTLIFLTSNLGARGMMDAIKPSMGFTPAGSRTPGELSTQLDQIAIQAVRKHFSPEFVNRIDHVVTYRPLDAESVAAILDQHIFELERHVHTRLGARSFDLDVSAGARAFLIERGTSPEYGARELRRMVHRHLTQPLAALVADDAVHPGAVVHVDVAESGDALSLRPEGGAARPERRIEKVLVVDDNEAILRWTERALRSHRYEAVTASSVRDAGRAMASTRPDAAVLDYVLPDGDGVALAMEILGDHPDMVVVLMSGMELDEEDELVCRHLDIPILTKPFLVDELVVLLESREAAVPRARWRTA
ncbi:MAG: AAA family ATPase, partial [Gemmatimonadota bacterium]|nr:AAA family ATPase [Gemmatimonadota bacterium]